MISRLLVLAIRSLEGIPHVQKSCFRTCHRCLQAIADNPITMPEPASTDAPFYLEANVGTLRQHWIDSNFVAGAIAPVPTISGNPADTITRGAAIFRFAYGLDAGWRFANQLALELGWYQFNSVSISAARTTAQVYSVNASVHSWLAYLAFRITLLSNADHTFNFFAKIGGVFDANRLQYNGTDNAATPFNGATNNNYWSAITAVGINVDLTQNLYLGLQALYVLPNLTVYHVPEQILVVTTLGVHF